MDTHKDRIVKGTIYACIAFLMFTLSNAMNKLLAGIHHPVEIAFWRNLVDLLPCIPYIIITKKTYLLKTKMPKILALRVFLGTTGLVFALSATQNLPMSDSTVLFFTSILIIPVLAHFILKEKIGTHRWLAVFIGMSGVILIAQPSGNITFYGITLALCAAFVQAVIQVLLRVMKTEDPFTITFYLFLAGVLGPGLFLPFFWHTPTWHSASILLLVGITGGLGQYFLTRGFQMAPASFLAPFNYTGLIWATGLDIFLWEYVPGWNVYIGASIIIGAQIYILYREKIANKKNARHA